MGKKSSRRENKGTLSPFPPVLTQADALQSESHSPKDVLSGLQVKWQSDPRRRILLIFPEGTTQKPSPNHSK